MSTKIDKIIKIHILPETDECREKIRGISETGRLYVLTGFDDKMWSLVCDSPLISLEYDVPCKKV